MSEDLVRKISQADRSFSFFIIRTDHPFFPPVENDGPNAKWMSVVENLKSIDAAPGWGGAEKDGVRGGNAIKLFGIS